VHYQAGPLFAYTQVLQMKRSNLWVRAWNANKTPSAQWQRRQRVLGEPCQLDARSVSTVRVQ